MTHDGQPNTEPDEGLLRANTEHFQMLVDNISDALWIRSPDLRVVHYVSPGFERIWGRPVSALYDSPEKWIDYIVPADRARARAAFGAFIDEDRPLDVEYGITRPDGEVRWVRVRGFKARDATGKPMRLVGIVSDLTERRRAEEALRQSEEQMRVRTTALDAAANAVVITDAAGTIQWVNAAFGRLTGFTSEEAVGRNPRFLKSGEHPESRYRQMWETISRGEVWHGEIVNRRKDGELYHEDMTITPVRDGGGRIAQFIAIKQDITERKNAERAIQDLHGRLVAASRQAGMADVAIDVLHNVGNTLNSVNVSANLIARQIRESRQTGVAKLARLLEEHAGELAAFLTADPVGRKIPAYVSTLAEALETERVAISSEVDALRKHIQRVMEVIGRQEAVARSAKVSETFAAVDLVEAALRQGEEVSLGRGVAVVREYEARPLVTADRHKAAQILLNLVRNARDACARSGRSDPRIMVRVTRAGDRVRIAVSDNGAGIAPEGLARIFQADLPDRQEGAGSGLHRGATAAAELGGSLKAESPGPGQGATFVLELPCHPETEGRGEPAGEVHDSL